MKVYTLEVYTKCEGCTLIGVYASLEAVERGKERYLTSCFLNRLSADQKFVVDAQEVQQ